MDATAYKSKHSTPIRVEANGKLDLISPVLATKQKLNEDLKSNSNNNSKLAYIDADSQLDIDEEETYDNLPPTQPKQDSNGIVKLQLLMLKSQPISRSSPVLPKNQPSNYDDYEEEHYIKINPLHLKLKQMESSSSTSSSSSSLSSLTSLDKNKVHVNSTQSLESNATTNYDNDLEILAKQQQDKQHLALSSESESIVLNEMMKATNAQRMINETNSFKSLSSVALSSTSSLNSNLNENQNNYPIQVKKSSNASTTSSSGDFYLSLLNLNHQNQRQSITKDQQQQQNVIKRVHIKYPVVQRRNTNLIEYNPQSKKVSHHYNYNNKEYHNQNQNQNQMQTRFKPTQRHQSFNLRRKTTSSLMGAPVYEDYLCDKEVESYFDENPAYVDCLKKSQKLIFPTAPLPLPPPPYISASLCSQHEVVTTAPLSYLVKTNNSTVKNNSVVLHKTKCFNSSNFLVKPTLIGNSSMSFSTLSVTSSSSLSSSNTTSSHDSVTLTKSLIGAGIVRQNQSESYC